MHTTIARAEAGPDGIETYPCPTPAPRVYKFLVQVEFERPIVAVNLPSRFLPLLISKALVADYHFKQACEVLEAGDVQIRTTPEP